MSIENLKKILESEKDLAYLDWLFPKELNINNRDESIKSNNYKRRLDYETYIVGYEAATNRLLPLLEKAVEILSEINIDNPSFEDSRLEWVEIQIDKRDIARIREFLAEFKKMTEIKKEDL